MDSQSYKTISANANTVEKKWYLVDAEGEVLGRLASKVAKILRGKNKTNFTPHVDCGDNVVIINAEKVKLTGKKEVQKQYVRYTGYPGGQRFSTPKEILEKDASKLIEKSIKGMLPKTKLGNKLFTNLYVYNGPEHKNEGQKPEKLELNSIK